MKLNHECVRDVLMYLEKQDYFVASDNYIADFAPISIEQIVAELPDYTQEEIFYTAFNLAQAGYIDALCEDSDFSVCHYDINYITFQGHEFLERIKDDSHWSSVKKGLSAVRDYSLSAIGSIAQGITGSLIDAYIKSKG